MKLFSRRTDNGFHNSLLISKCPTNLVHGIVGSKVTARYDSPVPDIWSLLDLYDSVTGWRGKLALAGNTWRARWKYRQFTDMSWLKALWIQAKGVSLEKEVRL